MVRGSLRTRLARLRVVISKGRLEDHLWIHAQQFPSREVAIAALIGAAEEPEHRVGPDHFEEGCAIDGLNQIQLPMRIQRSDASGTGEHHGPLSLHFSEALAIRFLILL